MAMVMRTMSASCSGARVVQCGMRNVVSQYYSENTCSRRASSSGDSLQLRCQAATSTAVTRETAAERCLEDSRAALRGSFEAASASGTSECEEGLEFLSVAHYGRRGGGDWYPGLITTAPKPVKEDTIASFEAALHGAGRNAGMIASLAVRAWRTLGDAARAEELYVKALQLAPDDSSIQASYAQFLWQCDV